MSEFPAPAADQGAGLNPPFPLDFPADADPEVLAAADEPEVSLEEGAPNLKPKPTAHDLVLIAAGEKLIDADALAFIAQRASQEDLKVLLGACARLLDELEA